MNAFVAEKLGVAKRIYVPHDPHTRFHSQAEFLLRLGLQTRGEPQNGLRVLAPSGSGKTAAAEALVEIIRRAFPDHPHPVVKVSAESSPTPRKLMQSILLQFGDRHHKTGTEFQLKQRVYRCFDTFRTMLLIIEEIQHLNQGFGPRHDTADYLKRLLDDGAAPIVFMGTEDAKKLFEHDLQLSSRLLEPCDIEPLNRAIDVDRSLLSNFVSAFDQALVQEGIFSRKSGLEHTLIRGHLHHISGGVVGRVARLLYVAQTIALRRGGECIEVFDLAQATDTWAIPNGLTEKNPFRQQGGAR
ncbi:MAG: TniB family NTP-binding protein [Rhizobium rhizophilum]